ncbi:MAG: hypothetical protein U9P10_09740 [Thermodesulfobacteriota bacterium]|nr:hypothetical protein [Thermodesulfobacteriota bacterium]
MDDTSRRGTWFLFSVLMAIILILCLYIWQNSEMKRQAQEAGLKRQGSSHVTNKTISDNFIQPGSKKDKIHQAGSPPVLSRPRSDFVIPVKTGKWRSVDPGASGNTLASAIHPVNGTLLVSSDMWHSLLISRDRGKSYHPAALKDHATVTVVAPHPERPGVWYAGVDSHTASGIYSSRDDGESWQLIHNNSRASYTNSFGVVIVTGTQALPEKSAGDNSTAGTSLDTLLWHFKNQGPFISYNSGRDFTDFSMGVSPENCRGPFVQTDHGNRTTIYLAGYNGLYKRELAEPRWQRITSLPRKEVVSIAWDSAKKQVWVSFQDGRIYRKDATSDGHYWKKIFGPMPKATILRTHSKKPGWIWCFSHGRAGLFRSRNGGETWEWLTRIPLYNGESFKNNVPRVFRYRSKITRDFFFIDPGDPDRLLLGQSLASSDGGATWHYSPMDYSPETRSWRGNGLTLLTCYEAWWDNANPNRVHLGFSDTGLMRSSDRGKSVEVIWEQNYPDIYSLACWSRTLLNTSGSCMAFAVDPDRPATQYYAMSGKGGSSASGVLLKTTDDGRHWEPVLPETSGLPRGIITDLVLLPGKGYHKRKIYALVNVLEENNQPGGGIYLSKDSGRSWSLLADISSFSYNLPLMDIGYCRDHPGIMYLASTYRTGKRPGKNMKRIPERPGRYGDIFRSEDGGKTWSRTGGKALACSVEVAVHPRKPDIVYAAVAPGKITTITNKKENVDGGIYRTTNGGETWEQVVDLEKLSPDIPLQPTSIAINPALPDIVYTAIENAGVLRSTNGGDTWQRVDWEHLKRYQSSYHSLTINPHDPAEFYLALFGNAFLAFRDPVADKLLKQQRKGENYVRNGDFELTDGSGTPLHWSWKNSTTSPAMLSIAKAPGGKGNALRVKMNGKGKKKEITCLETRIPPHGITAMRGKTVRISYDICAKKAKFLDRPVLSLVEIKNGYPRVTSELPAALAYTDTSYRKVRINKGDKYSGKWFTMTGTAEISEDVNQVKLVLYTTCDRKNQEFYIDDVKLCIGFVE